MKNDSGNDKGNEETLRNSGADADALNRDFRILEENRKKLDAALSFDDYIKFVTEVNEFAGHPRKKFRPITGDFKM
jgi:hypothetical protein